MNFQGNLVLKDMDNSLLQEVTNRQVTRDRLNTADTGLRTNLDTEASTRASADATQTTNLTAHAGQTTAHGSDGNVVGVNTLNNAINTHASQTQGVHGISTTAGNALVGTNDPQTLYNKTLVSPIIQGGNITQNITVEPGVTVDGVDISVLETSLTSEASTRATADSALGTRIDGVNTSLSSEVTTRESADTTLGSRIDTVQTNLNNHTNSGNTSAHSFGNISGQIGDSQIPVSVSRLGNSIESGEITDNTIRVIDLNAGDFSGWDQNAADDFTQAQGDARYAAVGHTHTPASIGAAPASHTHPASDLPATTSFLGSSIDSSEIVDNSITVNDIFQSETDSTSLDSRYVNEGGDTMTGDIAMNDTTCNTNLGHNCRVDGVDVSALAADVATIPRVTTLPFSSITDSIADTQVPQHMRPFAFGTVTYFTAGDPRNVSHSYNIRQVDFVSSGFAGTGTVVRVFFSTASSDANYAVTVTNAGPVDLSTAPAPAPAIVRKTTTYTDILIFNTADVVVFHP